MYLMHKAELCKDRIGITACIATRPEGPYPGARLARCMYSAPKEPLGIIEGQECEHRGNNCAIAEQKRQGESLNLGLRSFLAVS